MTTDRTSWAQRMADQNEKIAQQLYDDELKAVETFGPQPLDSETGEPQQRIPGPEQADIHMLLRDNAQAMLMTVMYEANRLGLSNGILPRQAVMDMIAAERRFLKMDGGE